MTIVHEVRLIQVDPRANANKFYVCSLDSSGTLTKRWGRVGATGQTKVERNATRADVEAAAYAKERRGYQRVDAIDTPTSNAPSAPTNAATLAAAAKASLMAKPSKVLEALIERIATANKHAIELASGGQITFNATGQATTALGLVSAASVARARRLMDEIATLPATDTRRASLVADYLTLVPQKVPSKRGWHETFAVTPDAQAKQYDLLDALVAVVPATKSADADTACVPEVKFRYQVAVADAATTKRIAEKFEADRNARHTDVASQKVKRVFVLTDTADGDVRAAQEAVHQDDVARDSNLKRAQHPACGPRRRWHGHRHCRVRQPLRPRNLCLPRVDQGVSLLGWPLGHGGS